MGWGKVGGSKSFEHFGYVAWHRNGHAVFVEGDVHPEVCITGGFNGELGIVRLESGDEMVGVILCSVFDAKVVHKETECDVAGEMFEQAGRVRALDVAVRLKMRDKAKLAEATGLRETIHAFAYFKVDGVVVEEGFKVVGGYSGGREFVALNSYVLKAGGGKESAEVKVFDIDGKPFLAFGYSGLEKNFDHVQAGSAC